MYEATCGGDGSATACYLDNVINNGTSDLAMAYFEFVAIRVFSDNTTTPTISSSSSPSAGPRSSSSSTSNAPGATNSNTNQNTHTNQNAASPMRPGVTDVAAWMAGVVGAVTGLAWVLL